MKSALIVILFLSITAGAQALKEAPAREADCVLDLTSSPPLAPDMPNEAGLREAFIAEFAEMIFADEKTNQIWIDDALNPRSVQDFHALIENSWLKKLNDKIIKDKDLVTALTNFHKKLFLEEFYRRTIQLKHSPYQDFKSTRLTMPPPVDTAKLADLEKAFIDSVKDFRSHPRVVAIIRAEDLKNSWFSMGVGQNEAEAAFAARDARENGKNGVSYFWDPDVVKRANAKLAKIKEMNETIMLLAKDSGLVVREEGFAGLDIDLFAAARKATPADFLATINQLFPNNGLDQKTAELILEFTQLADEFSPSVLVAKRELLTIHDAPFGAFSLDFIGLGAENLRGTVKALVKARGLKEAIRLTRVHEREITKLFVDRKEMVRKEARDYFGNDTVSRFSGDDGIIIPMREITLRDQLYLVQRLARLMPKPYFRMAMINAEGAADPNSSQLITHGESIEKELRSVLLRELGVRRLGELALETFIPDAGKLRKVFLIMSGKKKLTEAEKKVIRNSFPKAVKTIEAQVQKQGLQIEYDPTEIFAIFGKNPY